MGGRRSSPTQQTPEVPEKVGLRMRTTTDIWHVKEDLISRPTTYRPSVEQDPELARPTTGRVHPSSLIQNTRVVEVDGEVS